MGVHFNQMEACLGDISVWMSANMLVLNQETAELTNFAYCQVMAESESIQTLTAVLTPISKAMILIV